MIHHETPGDEERAQLRRPVPPAVIVQHVMGAPQETERGHGGNECPAGHQMGAQPVDRPQIVIEVLDDIEDADQVERAAGQAVGDRRQPNIDLDAEALTAVGDGLGGGVEGRHRSELAQHVHHLPGPATDVEDAACPGRVSGEVAAQDRRDDPAPALEPPMVTLDGGVLVMQ